MTENCANSALQEVAIVYQDPSNSLGEVFKYFFHNTTSNIASYLGYKARIQSEDIYNAPLNFWIH